MLVQLVVIRKDELEADFQQYYGLNLERIGIDYSVAHAATLATQLPSDSRCMRQEIPGFEWSPEMYMLSAIEHGVRVLAWIQANQGKRRSAFPKPIEPPSKRGAIQNKIKSTDTQELDRLLQ